jgi:hypothetical protein
MHANRLMFIVLVLSAIGVSVVPTRAMCPGPLPLEVQFAGSQTVFVGRAIAQRIVPTGSSAGTRATETTFEVEELWKGQANAMTLRVQTCGWNDGSFAVTCSEGLGFVPASLTSETSPSHGCCPLISVG